MACTFRSSFYRSLLIAPALLISQVAAQGQVLVPGAVRSLYEAEPDSSVSDEFNASRKNARFDTGKWHHREARPFRPGLGTGRFYVQEKNGTLICFGRKSTKLAGGIVGNTPTQYGFYMTRFRMEGIRHNRGTSWHPSIWGNRADGDGTPVPVLAGDQKTSATDWMEIDMMEVASHHDGFTRWTSDAPSYIWLPRRDADGNPNNKVITNPNRDPDARNMDWKKAVMLDAVDFTLPSSTEAIGASDFDEWMILGMEYHKNYLQMWVFSGGTWNKVGRTVTFTKNRVRPSVDTLPRKVRKPLHWHIGNLFLPSSVSPNKVLDSRLVVDYWRFYPLR